MTESKLVTHELGFLELQPKPTMEELAKFYNTNYFDSKNFEIRYDDEEYFHKFHNFREAEFVSGKTGGNFLDIGCGEGFSLDYFAKKGWDVTGTDFSSDGVRRHFGALADRLITGDLFEALDQLAASGKKFDLIVSNNVLEHVLDPLLMLTKVRSLLKPDGWCRMQVPNDNSFLQQNATSKGLAPDKFWFAPHEHMSYFNGDNLQKTMVHCGYRNVEVLGDFPIDFFLFNRDANYLLDKTKGKNCHRARVDIDNMLVRKSVEALVEFRRGCGRAGVGRNIICYGQGG